MKSLPAKIPMLYRPSPGHEFIIQTDTSDVSLGAVIYLIINGKECVIKFSIQAMKKVERNFSVTEY